MRRRVVLPARLRLGAAWTDVCILNVSSRGMLIQAPRPARQGTVVELRRDSYVITGRVMWGACGKFGLQCDHRVPVDDLLSLGSSKSLQLIAADGVLIERRRSSRRPRTDARLLGRVIQFAGVIAIALALSVVTVLWVRTALTAPLRAAETALGR